jgi:hypothetical protein
MASDPLYLANVSSACMDALREAQQMVEAGEVGPDLLDLVRHARELHDIMVEELADSSRVMGEYAGGVLLDFADRIGALERQLDVKPNRAAS